MKYLLSFLQDYVEITESPEKLAADLSMFAHEVESIEKVGDDVVFDLEITPNRGDCLSHLGLARQIAAMYNREVKSITYNVESIETESLDKKIEVQISDPKICPRYTACVIDNIEILSSPEWLKSRLEKLGVRSINNIVDITNYIMLALGQPMHAYDYDKIQNGKFDVRLSHENDEVLTLDGKNHILPKDVIIIQDDEKIYDLAGIMGGDASQVTDGTKTIVLEGAIFDPVLIRRAAKKLHHPTDASYRYERGVDLEGNMAAFDLAQKLILETCANAKFGEILDIKNYNNTPRKIHFETSKINQLLGTTLNDDEVSTNLRRLYFDVGDHTATVPTFRLYDVSIWQDLAEEVARVFGINNIVRNNLTSAPKDTQIDEWTKRESIKEVLVRIGFAEVYSYSFADKQKMAALNINIDSLPKIIDPISPETEYLRADLKLSLLEAVSKNPWSPEINIFEIGKVFGNGIEKWQLGIASCDKKTDLFQKVLDNLGTTQEIQSIEKQILDKFKIRRSLSIVLIDLEKINISLDNVDLDNEVSSSKYIPLSKYPPTIRDLAFVVDTNIASTDIEKTILEASDSIFLTEIFDEFESSKFGENKKSIAIHVWFQDKSGNMDENKVSEMVKKIIQNIETKYNAKLRS